MKLTIYAIYKITYTENSNIKKDSLDFVIMLCNSLQHNNTVL